MERGRDGKSRHGLPRIEAVTSVGQNAALSITALVNSSMNSSTPSVRSMICSAISWGGALPPVTCMIISARCGRDRRLRLIDVTCERPVQGGANSGRKVMISKTRRWPPGRRRGQ